jgi:hypothetical protein
MVDGYWVRFSTVNNLSTNTIGLSHNYNNEKKLFVINSLGIKEYDFWKSGLNKLITDERIGAQHRLVMPKGELTVVYDFFRNNPVDRFNSKENYHRMMIGSWDDLRFREIARFVGRIAFFAPALLFGLYYFFVFLISRGNLHLDISSLNNDFFADISPFIFEFFRFEFKSFFFFS